MEDLCGIKPLALLGFLEEVDKELEVPITLVAVGGTALTLLHAKTSTIDVDFTIPTTDYTVFEKTEVAWLAPWVHAGLNIRVIKATLTRL